LSAAPTLVTLLTDFGSTDYYVAAVKGVILSRAPECSLVDIGQDVGAGDIEEGAFLLEAASRYFPPATVHLAVVDPGVGSDRRILVAEGPRGRFVAPDNGLLTAVLENTVLERTTLHVVENHDLFLEESGNTFHGRDRFAPVAAFLATGGAARDLGPVVTDPCRLRLEPPRKTARGLVGRVAHIDRYGNLVTNLPSQWLNEGSAERAVLGKHFTLRFVSHYQELLAGEAGVIPGSLGTLELSLDGASLADHWTVRRGDQVVIEGEWPRRQSD